MENRLRGKSIIFGDKKITPSKIVCVGRNFVEHIEELNNEMPQNMVIFNKPNSSLSNRLYYFTEDTRFEAEISLLIENNQIAGIGLGLDLTDAKMQNYLKSKGLPWERAKAFDNSAVMSRFVPLDGDIEYIRFELYINSELRQFADYSLMIYKPKAIIEEIASFMSFEDGDIIMTGTPKGVGNYKKGDIFEGKLYLKDKQILEVEWIAQ